MFGHIQSNLRDWVIEKTDGWIAAPDIISISIENLRRLVTGKSSIGNLQIGQKISQGRIGILQHLSIKTVNKALTLIQGI